MGSVARWREETDDLKDPVSFRTRVSKKETVGMDVGREPSEARQKRGRSKKVETKQTSRRQDHANNYLLEAFTANRIDTASRDPPFKIEPHPWDAITVHYCVRYLQST